MPLVVGGRRRCQLCLRLLNAVIGGRRYVSVGGLGAFAPTAIQGERGVLRFPADWLIRIRHNPFYDFLESRALEWIDAANR